MNDFNYFEQINDIALIKMNGRVRYTNVIYPVCLPVHYTTQGDTAVAGKIYRSLGWGATEQATHSASLLEINVRSIPCPHNTYGIYFCTTSQRVDVCRGDSGGPLARSFNVSGIIRSVQFGIVAHGSSLKCGIAGGTYYTNVSYYMPWIVEKLAEHTDPILI
ncbi:hypothetical protein KR009_008838 [Drosophila setifemur]|nr:hypothetical protein KR009_008838 [Drosophila setifemur]